jgi:hypothetical protein
MSARHECMIRASVHRGHSVMESRNGSVNPGLTVRADAMRDRTTPRRVSVQRVPVPALVARRGPIGADGSRSPQRRPPAPPGGRPCQSPGGPAVLAAQRLMSRGCGSASTDERKTPSTRGSPSGRGGQPFQRPPHLPGPRLRPGRAGPVRQQQAGKSARRHGTSQTQCHDHCCRPPAHHHQTGPAVLTVSPRWSRRPRASRRSGCR